MFVNKGSKANPTPRLKLVCIVIILKNTKTVCSTGVPTDAREGDHYITVQGPLALSIHHRSSSYIPAIGYPSPDIPVKQKS